MSNTGDNPMATRSSTQWHVLGAGAIGCLLASKLHRSGTETTLIVRGATAAPRTDLNVSFQQKTSQFNLPLSVAGDHDSITHLLVTTKAYDVAVAVNSVAHRLAPKCTILLLVNGMGIAEQLREELPQQEVFCGTTTHGAYRLAAREIVHAGSGATRIGQQGRDQQKAPPWFTQWSQALDDCIWDADIDSALWSKLAVNCVINPLTALYGCRNGELGTQQALRLEVARLCEEIVIISRAAGFTGTAENLEETVATVISGTAQNQSSMLQDLQHGQRTEIDYITGYLLEVASRLGIDAPHNTNLLKRLQAHVR